MAMRRTADIREEGKRGARGRKEARSVRGIEVLILILAGEK
jgi:hypothetical protein